ncbi:hypothetical protein P1P68_31430 [Streptomyces scabiei]|uniref:hypothetical protein n=1 Tax=Streptomyces scabiei TaxID=1930 RepID=UPI00298FF31B|nr:hypothetical protein [Streptomyces scabiei]MDW8809190.1 hypothetical protein [Streptomyces scabiei]
MQHDPLAPYAFTPYAFTPYAFTPYAFTPYVFTPYVFALYALPVLIAVGHLERHRDASQSPNRKPLHRFLLRGCPAVVP